MREKMRESTSRRKFLALVGASSSVLAGGSTIHLTDPETASRAGTGTSQRGSESDRVDTAGQDREESDTFQPADAVDITAFDALAGKNSQQVALQNREAIHQAALEAGANGTVYVPEGRYYFGHSTPGNQFRFGKREPSGVSFVGDGAGRSKLVLTSTLDADSSYRAFRYDREDGDGNPIDHGDVTIRGLCFDGNYEALDLEKGRTVWGFDIEGSGHFTFEDAWIQGWWSNGTKFTGPSAEIRRCRYQENAIGVAQTNDQQTGGHHITARPTAGNRILIEDCAFMRCSGTVVNRTYNSGEVVLRRAWVRGTGYGCFKLSETAGTTRAKQVYYDPHTLWMDENLPASFEQNGRWFLYRVYGDSHTPTVILNNVLARGLSRGFLLCYGDTDLVLKGDMITVRHAAKKDSRHSVIRGDSGLTFDVGQLSVHDSGGTVFDAPGSTGVIEDLFRNGNGGLGNVGDVAVTDHPNSKPLQPDIVNRSDVGLDFEALSVDQRIR